MSPLLIFAMGTSLFCFFGLAACVIVSLSGNRDMTRRVAEITRQVQIEVKPRGPSTRDLLLRVLQTSRSRIGMETDQRLRDRFVSAGLKSQDLINVYFAARILCPILGVILGTFIPGKTMLWIAVLAGVGYIAPNTWLERKIKGRRERIRKSMPDSIDLLVICVDAGLGLDQAMLRVGQELANSHPEINEEFLQINREQRAGRPRVDAWKGMAERTKLTDVLAFVGMLIQTERFGTPIARALSSFSDDMRLKRKQAAEEKAAKTTVKMLFPLVLFIFPCIFIVLLGPAIISISRGMLGMTQ